MKREVALSVLALSVFVGVLMSAPGEASAQRRASLEEGPIVRRQLLYRSSRFELQPRIGGTLNDSYKRNLLTGLDLNYYLTNKFGLGVNAAFGALKVDTDLLEQINATVDAERTGELAFATTTLLFDVHVSYVPIFGKFSIFKSAILDYDLHLLGGFGGALLAAEGNVAGEKLSGFKPGPMIGGGMRIFMGDSFALTFDVRDYIFSSADIQEGEINPQTELRNNFTVNIGFSLFFPGEVPISR